MFQKSQYFKGLPKVFVLLPYLVFHIKLESKLFLFLFIFIEKYVKLQIYIFSLFNTSQFVLLTLCNSPVQPDVDTRVTVVLYLDFLIGHSNSGSMRLVNLTALLGFTFSGLERSNVRQATYLALACIHCKVRRIPAALLLDNVDNRLIMLKYLCAARILHCPSGLSCCETYLYPIFRVSEATLGVK